jgi:hypothetical protein
MRFGLYHSVPNAGAQLLQPSLVAAHVPGCKRCPPSFRPFGGAEVEAPLG